MSIDVMILESKHCREKTMDVLCFHKHWFGLGFFLTSDSWMQLFQGKAFLLRNMPGHFRTANKFLHCLCCLFLLVHILICLLGFYHLSLQLVWHGSWWLGQFLWTLHSWGVFQRWQWHDFMAYSSTLSPMALRSQALGFKGCFLTEAQEQKMLVLTLLASFLTLFLYPTRKEENPAIILAWTECA